MLSQSTKWIWPPEQKNCFSRQAFTWIAYHKDVKRAHYPVYVPVYAFNSDALIKASFASTSCALVKSAIMSTYLLTINLISNIAVPHGPVIL